MTDYQPDILKFLEKIVQRNTIAYKDVPIKKILILTKKFSGTAHRNPVWSIALSSG